MGMGITLRSCVRMNTSSPGTLKGHYTGIGFEDPPGLSNRVFTGWVAEVR